MAASTVGQSVVFDCFGNSETASGREDVASEMAVYIQSDDGIRPPRLLASAPLSPAGAVTATAASSVDSIHRLRSLLFHSTIPVPFLWRSLLPLAVRRWAECFLLFPLVPLGAR